MSGANRGPALAAPVGRILPRGDPSHQTLHPYWGFVGTPHSPQPAATSAMSLPGLRTRGGTRRVPGACVGLGRAKKSLLRSSRNWKKCFLLKCFLLPVALER